MDMWGFGESQETVGVSPAMFAEFIFPYQLPILERFGLNCYGCCEPLDKRWHIVQRIPRLRRVSVSAWANLPRMAEMLGDRYIFSWKPAPADLAMDSFDEDAHPRRAARGVPHHARLPGRGHHEGQPHHPQRSEPGDPLGAHRARRSGASVRTRRANDPIRRVGIADGFLDSNL